MVQLSCLDDTMLIRDRVYEVLKREIVKGGFKPGQTLNISRISNQLHVSNAPVREALNLLSKDGLIDLSPYKKATVTSSTELDYDTVHDLRMFLEPYAARTSLSQIPQDNIDQVRALLKKAAANPSDLDLYIDSDLMIHELLYKSSASALLVSILDSVRTYTMRYYARLLQRIADKSGSPASAITLETAEHLSILDAADARNADKLVELLTQHISKIGFKE